MKRILGILGLLVAICIVTSIATYRVDGDGHATITFLKAVNIENLIRRSALFGIISIGAAFVIITGGIDLSTGSIICLIGCLLPWLLTEHGWPVPIAIGVLLGLALALGAAHGLLVTKLGLQPFVVTLCALLLYRGIARGIVDDQTQGFGIKFGGLKSFAAGKIPLVEGFSIPTPCLFLIVVAVASAVFLNRTIWGRYLFALGRNEEAARFSGIRTDRMTTLAYVISGGLAGLGGMLFVLDVNSAQPSDFGNFYELYAIAGAVLGGCALRGGEGSILGVVIGASVMQVLRNSITLVDEVPNQLEFAVIGAVILGGVIADEVVKRVAANRRLKR